MKIKQYKGLKAVKQTQKISDAQVMQELDKRMDRELPRRLSIDMGGVTFMDSSGIAVLLRAYRRMTQLQGSMLVSNVPAQAQRVFQAAGLHRIIEFV